MKEYVLGTSAFIELQLGMVVEDQIELPSDIFRGLGHEGLYIISYEYLSDGYPEQPAPKNFWKGKIKTKSVTLFVGKKSSNKPLETTR